MVLVLASRWVMTSRCSFNSMWMYETACANEVRTVVHPLPSSGRATYVAPAMPRIGGETDLNQPNGETNDETSWTVVAGTAGHGAGLGGRADGVGGIEPDRELPRAGRRL